MPIYTYELLDETGKTINGEINADDRTTALQKIKQMNLVIVSLEEKKSTEASSFFTLSLTSPKKVTLTDLSIFSRQLAAMLSAGIPITRSIATLSQQTTNKTLAAALSNIAVNIEGGMTLTDAFEQYPKIFDNLYISMLRAGEAGGLLEVTLNRLSNQLQKDKKLKEDVKSATSYPKMVGIFAGVIFLAMMVFLVPTFESYIPDPDKVPALSAVIFAISRSIRTRYYIWILAVALGIGSVYAFVKSPAGHNIWESNKLRMPVFGEIILKSVVARFARTLATLIEGGVPVIKALQTAGPTSGSDLVARAVDNAIIQIGEGRSIAGPLEESGIFPPMVINMISIGEESGTLSSLLDKIAEFYEEDVEAAAKSLSAVLEPIILVAVALLVGGILISLYLPIFTTVVQSTG